VTHPALARISSFVLPLVAIGLGLVALPVAAEPPAMGGLRGATQNVNWGAMPLTATQKDAIKKHDAVWQQAFEQLYPEIVQERKRLKQLLMNPNTDHDAIFRSLQHLEDKEQELRYEAVKNFLLKKQELTPTQREQMLRNMPPNG
jgi:Spy/CpxP family protein refolding chaperone